MWPPTVKTDFSGFSVEEVAVVPWFVGFVSKVNFCVAVHGAMLCTGFLLPLPPPVGPADDGGELGFPWP